MARLDLSPSVRGYLELHAVDPELAYGLGVRSAKDSILYRYRKPRDGETFVRRRDLNDERKVTRQPANEPLILWWPAGRPDPGADVVLCEGEPDALAVLSALNGDPYAVAAVPGTETPVDRLTGDLGTAARVYVAMDGDEPGRKAADKFARALQQFTEIRVVRLGDDEDLASRLYRETDRRAWLLDLLNKAPTAPKVKLKEDSGYRRKKADRTRDLLAKGIDPDRLDLAELLDEIAAFIGAFIVLPVIHRGDVEYRDVAAHVLAPWVVHSWCFGAVFATPYLRVVSAAPVSAKSLLLEVLASISRRGWLAVNPSPAILYRKIDRDRPSLFLDELDNFAIDEKRDALAVLNSGYKPGAKVPRCNERGELEEFACFCPKAYAGLDERQLVPTLLSRSITIRMETKRPSDRVEMWIAPDVEPRAAEIREKCEAWADRHVDELKGHRPNLVGLVNRQAEVWWILLSLGELAGGEWTEHIREAAKVLGVGGDETDRPAQQVQLLMDIDAAFGDDAAVFTVDLLKHLNELEESPWGDRRKGDGLNARALAALLRPFRIRPRTVRIGEETAKGYHVEQFQDAFDRYLPNPSQNVTSVTSVTTAPLSRADVTDVTDVTDTERAEEAGDLFADIDADPMAPPPAEPPG